MNGRGWFRWNWVGPGGNLPSGYTYIGPCRCGMGPHAYYKDPSGRIVHAWHFYPGAGLPFATGEDVKTALDLLKQEKSVLEKRIEELEKQLKEKKEEKT